MIDYASSGSRSASRDHVDVVGFVRRLDWLLLVAVAALVAYGLWAVAGITRFDVEGNESYYVVRQAIAVGLGFAGFLLALAIDPDRYRRAQKGIYAVMLLLMLLVFPLADTTRGSKRWIEIGSFQFQPSEFGKLLFVLALAGFLADRVRRLGDPRVVLQAIGLALVPILLVFKQPDLGTALVYVLATAACLFVAGIRWSQLIALAVARGRRDRERGLVPARAGGRRAQAVSGRSSDRVRQSRARSRRRQLQPQSVDHGGRLGRAGRPRRQRRHADQARLPARACDRLRLRLARRAARLLRRGAAARSLPARCLARVARDHGRRATRSARSSRAGS